MPDCTILIRTSAEFWNVFTRPIDRNGFGLPIAAAERAVHTVERMMVHLPDSEAVYRQWRELIVRYQVAGVKVHDARIVSSMLVHGVTHLLTLKVADFERYGDVINVVDPHTVVK